MPEYLAPGVYIEEIATGPRPIEGVSTSTAGFVGETERGSTRPTLVTSWADFQRTLRRLSSIGRRSTRCRPTHHSLPYAVRGLLRQRRPAALRRARRRRRRGRGQRRPRQLPRSKRPAKASGATTSWSPCGRPPWRSAGTPTADWFRIHGRLLPRRRAQSVRRSDRSDAARQSESPGPDCLRGLRQPDRAARPIRTSPWPSSTPGRS